jgi:uncharacterized protein YabN with tetrapyrrole methylase and pyrophosphatase domain
MAFRLGERAAGVGFDWPDVQGPLAKVREELGEVEAAVAEGDPEQVEREVGDLLFAAVNVARKAGVRPGGALERANARFRRRFEVVERLAAERDIDLSTAGIDRLEELWVVAKRGEDAAHG